MKFYSSLIVVACLIAAPTTSRAQMGNADVRFVPDNCFFVLQFDMEKLFSYEKMGSKNLEKIAAFFKKQGSFDLMSMKTMTIQFCEGEDSSDFGEDTFGLAMTFSKKVEKDAFLEKMNVPFEEATKDGIKYHRSTESYGPSVYFPDDKTIVMGMPAALESMIGKKSGKSNISSLLRSADPSAEVKGAFHTGKMYEVILEQINNELPFKPFNIVKVFGEAQTAVIQGKVTSSTPIYIQVGCKTEKGAEQLAKKGKLLVDLGKATIPITRETMEAQHKELKDKDLGGFEKFQFQQLEMGLTGLEVAEKILANTDTSTKGKTAYLKVKQMGGIKELMPLLAKMFGTQFEAIDSLQQGLDIPPPDGFEEELKKDF